MMKMRVSPQNTPSTEGAESITVEQEKLNPSLQAYVKALADQCPFTSDIHLDRRQLIVRLSALWPKLPDWENQAQEIWEHIAAIVQEIPTIEATPDIVLRISVSASRLAPQALTQADESAVLATFDAIEGVVHRYIMPVSNPPQILDDMAIPAGLMVLCQPMPPLLNVFTDNRAVKLGAGNVYSERARDLVLTGDAIVEEPYILPEHRLSAQNSRHPAEPTHHPEHLGETVLERAAGAALGEKIEEKTEANEEKRQAHSAKQAPHNPHPQPFPHPAAETEAPETERASEAIRQERNETLGGAEVVEMEELARETMMAESEITSTEKAEPSEPMEPKVPERPEAELSHQEAVPASENAAPRESAPEVAAEAQEPAIGSEALSETHVETNVAEQTNVAEPGNPQEGAAEAVSERTEAAEPASETAVATNPEERPGQPEAEPLQEAANGTEQAVETGAEPNAPESANEQGAEPETSETAQPETESPQQEAAEPSAEKEAPGNEPRQKEEPQETGQEAPSEQEPDIREQMDKMKEQFGDEGDHHEQRAETHRVEEPRHNAEPSSEASRRGEPSGINESRFTDRREESHFMGREEHHQATAREPTERIREHLKDKVLHEEYRPHQAFTFTTGHPAPTHAAAVSAHPVFSSSARRKVMKSVRAVLSSAALWPIMSPSLAKKDLFRKKIKKAKARERIKPAVQDKHKPKPGNPDALTLD